MDQVHNDVSLLVLMLVCVPEDGLCFVRYVVSLNLVLMDVSPGGRDLQVFILHLCLKEQMGELSDTCTKKPLKVGFQNQQQVFQSI